MKYVSSILTGDMSGSAGSITAGRGRWGAYFRRRNMPTNPNTSQQAASRQSFGSLAAVYASLGDARWQAWADYAQNTVWTDRLGKQIRLSGQQHFIRVNQPRMLAETLRPATTLPLELDAPPVYELGTLPVVQTVTLVSDGTTAADLTVTHANTPGTGTVYVYLSQPVNVQRRYFRGPYKMAQATVAVGAGAPLAIDLVDPASVWGTQGNPVPPATGIVYGYTRFQNDDGRLSERAYFGPIVIEEAA